MKKFGKLDDKKLIKIKLSENDKNNINYILLKFFSYGIKNITTYENTILFNQSDLMEINLSEIISLLDKFNLEEYNIKIVRNKKFLSNYLYKDQFNNTYHYQRFFIPISNNNLIEDYQIKYIDVNDFNNKIICLENGYFDLNKNKFYQDNYHKIFYIKKDRYFPLFFNNQNLYNKKYHQLISYLIKNEDNIYVINDSGKNQSLIYYTIKLLKVYKNVQNIFLISEIKNFENFIKNENYKGSKVYRLDTNLTIEINKNDIMDLFINTLNSDKLDSFESLDIEELKITNKSIKLDLSKKFVLFWMKHNIKKSKNNLFVPSLFEYFKKSSGFKDFNIEYFIEFLDTKYQIKNGQGICPYMYKNKPKGTIMKGLIIQNCEII